MIGRLIAALLVLSWAAAASAESWIVDMSKSRLGFEGVQSGTKFEGRFKRFQASIDFDPADPAHGHAVIEVDLASAETGNQERDATLPQADWFDVKAFPMARFEATGFRATGGNAYEASGKLTIRDVTKNVVLPFTLDIQGNQAHAKGRVELVRTDFGVGQGEWRSGDLVALAVGVSVDLVAAGAEK